MNAGLLLLVMLLIYLSKMSEYYFRLHYCVCVPACVQERFTDYLFHNKVQDFGMDAMGNILSLYARRQDFFCSFCI